MSVSQRMKNVAFELACLADVAPAGISSPELAQMSSRILAAAYQVELGEVSIVVCPNCDTDLPKGCSGTFKDEGDACWLNRAAPETPADDTPPHLMAQGYRSGKIEDVCHECGGDRISRQSEAAFSAKQPCTSCAPETRSDADDTPPHLMAQGYRSGKSEHVALPNDKWVRADKQPNWALCLDPDNRFYGWKMYECNGNWVSGAKMTAEEVEKALGLYSLQPHRAPLEALHAALNR